MMLFTSIYGIVDGFFVSNFAGKSEFAALNLIWPYPMLLGAVGYMFGTGGTALVAKTLGEGNKDRANRYFSLIIYSTFITSVLLSVFGMFTLEGVAKLMGAEGKLLEDAKLYGYIIMAATPTYVMQVVFQPFMITAERPRLGLWITVASGMTNIVLDIIFVGILSWGLAGAAWASVISQVVGMAWPIIFFLTARRTTIKLGKASLEVGVMLKSCSNGLSELVTNVAICFVSMVYNWRLLIMVGEDGVAIYGFIAYVNMIFLAVFFGYSMGVSPVVSYHFGAGNRDEIKNLRKRSLNLESAASIVMTVSAMLLAEPLAKLFVGYDAGLTAMTTHAFRLYAFSYLLSYLNIFASSFFTALNDGVTSAIISFSRMLLFQLGSVMLLPMVLGLDGIWLSMLSAEILSLCITVFFFFRYRSKYGY
ncbi:MAG: polysaccharide biosynthesis C-terminal domain-containing protein [Bacteroidales bacterium]|nr:polysaccharide biosynthesis C-terminal domain-containing protein [Bacteroidales bacterium]